MKQIGKTPDIIAKLRRSAGDVSIDNLVVFEAIAVNTLPIRKRRPLYNGARFERHALLKMAAHLERESVPLQIQHDSQSLPIGRVFHGEVIDRKDQSELRVLFFVDGGASDVVRRIDSGVVDQVSVGLLSEQILCSECGFDFLGENSTPDHINNGVCQKGHHLGEDGVHSRLVGLDQWFELSLVGVGGAQNARIVSRDQSVFGSQFQRLAASGVDPNELILQAAMEKEKHTMDLEKLIADLATEKAARLVAEGKVTELTGTVAARDATIAELNTKIEDANKVVAAKADGDKALVKLRDVATRMSVASGDVGADLSAKSVDELVTILNEKTSSLKLVAHGVSKDAITDVTKADTPAVGAFRGRK